MQPINIRFGDTQRLKLDDVANVLGMSYSEVARAALYIGLKEIMALSANDVDRGIEFTSLNAVKSKQ